MNISELYRLTESSLADELTFLGTTIAGNPTRYALTAPIATSLSDAAEAYATALAEQETARAAFVEAVAAKTDLRASALELFAAYLNVVYAAPTVTDTDIASLGLAPRSSTRSAVVPQQPLGLVATPNPAGTVFLSWERNGNPYSVQFVIEAKVGTGEWEIAAMTTKAKITLENYVPGQEASFRVYAQKNELESSPSNVAVIYEGGEFAPLTIAA